MKTLYLLTEGDSDSLFYEACAERVSGRAFTPVCRRMRKGSGVGAVRASLQLAIGEISRMATGSGVHFLVAMDNDRGPNAAASEALSGSERARLCSADARKCDRYAMITGTLQYHLGVDHSRWLVPVAVAVPVEMIESWLLLIARSGSSADLPRFSYRESPLARQFYHPTEPPPQLKDRREALQAEDGFANGDEWALHLVTERLDPADLAMRSPSFALFLQSFDSWPRQG